MFACDRCTQEFQTLDDGNMLYVVIDEDFKICLCDHCQTDLLEAPSEA